MTAPNDKPLAERAIAAQLQRYCTAVDAYDGDGFAKLWTTDAEVDFGERYRGEPAGFMASMLEARSRTLAMTHQLQEFDIEVGSDLTEATSSAIVSAEVTRNTASGEQRRLVRGRYDDRWLFSDGQWLIRRRVYRAIDETLLS